MTPAEWVKLAGKGQWDVQVALRGPDCYQSDNVKWLTTAVIRRAMMGIIRVGGLIAPSGTNFVVVPSGSLKEQQGKVNHPDHHLLWDYSHFFGHVMEAATWLGLKIILVKADVWLKAVNESGLTKMVETLLTDPDLSEESKVLLTHHLAAVKSPWA